MRIFERKGNVSRQQSSEHKGVVRDTSPPLNLTRASEEFVYDLRSLGASEVVIMAAEGRLVPKRRKFGS